LESKQEILQANTASVLNALMAAEMGIKSPQVKIIAWRPDEGQEGLLEAARLQEQRMKLERRITNKSITNNNNDNKNLITIVVFRIK